MATTAKAPPTSEADMQIAPESSSTSSSSSSSASAGSWKTPPAMPTLPPRFPGLDALSLKKREQLFAYHAFKPIVAAGAPGARKAGKP